MYTFTIEPLHDVYSEIEFLCREHYAEMRARREALGEPVPAYAPRIDEYFKASRAGYLVLFVARYYGDPCGYMLVYVTNDMHNHEKIATEDTLFVTKSHRNGLGKRFVRFGLDHLNSLNTRKLFVNAVTDARVVPLWRRMGFKELATQMVYVFPEHNNVH